MIIISDTNILSSFASADALNLLPKLFPHKTIHIPPAVIEELQTALDHGQTHVERVFNALSAGEIQRIELTGDERVLMTTLPSKLHDGEREGIVICQTRKSPFLSNDRRAVLMKEKWNSGNHFRCSAPFTLGTRNYISR
jgi:predicted nucleic acid-binding protein